MAKSTVTIESLKQQGLKVALRHFDSDETSGAQTQAAVINPTEKTVKLGTSRCNPVDTFNRKKGRIMALGRAVNPRTSETLTFSNEEELNCQS
ncbi:MAG: hypothetical protein HC840_16855, partial [Leptolyngbyaceae cyanobacterium RM2_2_4]|nr:hypothetical protein [Leptolyngbyaceae cyanobacterium RM2_2_4]